MIIRFIRVLLAAVLILASPMLMLLIAWGAKIVCSLLPIWTPFFMMFAAFAWCVIKLADHK